jgi:hemerythrin-like domain-containing protein
MQEPLIALRFVHNAIRSEVAYWEQITDGGDFTEPATLLTLSQRLAVFEEFLKGHEAGENDVFYPAIEEVAPHVVRAYRMDHDSNDRIVEQMAREIESLGKGASPSASGAALNRAAVALRATMELHLAKEEEHLITLAEQLLGPEQQARVVGQMGAEAPRERLPLLNGFLFSRVSIDDGEGLLRVIQAVTPPPAFEGLTGMLAQVLTPTHWSALQQRIPNLTLAPTA